MGSAIHESAVQDRREDRLRDVAGGPGIGHRDRPRQDGEGGGRPEIQVEVPRRKAQGRLHRGLLSTTAFSLHGLAFSHTVLPFRLNPARPGLYAQETFMAQGEAVVTRPIAPPLAFGLRLNLSIMMFLQFAVWGAWAV